MGMMNRKLAWIATTRTNKTRPFRPISSQQKVTERKKEIEKERGTEREQSALRIVTKRAPLFPLSRAAAAAAAQEHFWHLDKDGTHIYSSLSASWYRRHGYTMIAVL